MPNLCYTQFTMNNPPRILKFFLFLVAFIALILKPSSVYSIDIGNIYPLAGHNLGYYISPILKAAILLAAIITFILIVGGGIGMIASAGNKQQQEKGRSAATAGIMGLALVVGAYWILQILKLFTGVDLLNTGL